MSGKSVNLLGMCGKIPSRGDFVAQQLTAGFVDSWNEWLQAVMAVSREQLGQAWLETYLTSPVWHFALSAGVCGADAVLGTLMPSVDQVGRHFPFTLARTMPGTPVHARLQADWATELQQQILLTLEDDFVFERWHDTLQQAEISWPEALSVNTSQVQQSAVRPAWVIRHQGQQQDDAVDAAVLLHHSYRQQFGRYCLWWTQGSELVPACTLVSSGLPQVSQYAAMLDGNWQRGQWQMADIICNGSDA